MKQKLSLLALLVSVYAFAQTPSYKVTISAPGSDGYYFVSPLAAANNPNTQMILDSAGELIYYKVFLGQTTYDFTLQPNGLMSFYRYGQYFLMDSTFNIVDTVFCKNGVNTDFHDMQILPNGHFLMLGEEYVTMDLSSYNYFLHQGAAGSSSASVLCAVIQELDENKNVVFEWHSKDYLPFNTVDPYWLNDSANVDWTHSNALALDNDGNILLSSRHLNEITKINRTDSSVMWRFGGKFNQFTFIGDTMHFYGQHDIRRIANGNITLYDNGIHTVSHGARALEYHLDEVNKTAEVKWSFIYDSTMFSYATGNVQRLANSNTLVNYGVNRSNRNIHFSIVDSLGIPIFELLFKDTLFGYRSFNYLSLPWSFHRPHISCIDSSGTTYFDAGAGYSSYQWNNGATTRLVTSTGLDTISVFVNYGEGGFISSGRYIVADTGSSCLKIYVTEILQEDKIRIFPNPVQNELTLIYSENVFESAPLEITDVSGRVVSIIPSQQISGKHTLNIPLEKLEAGIYFLRLSQKSYRFIKTR